MTEIWSPIHGYVGYYEASSFGDIRRSGKDRALRPGMSTTGYLTVVLCRDGDRKTHQVHRLVCAAFNGPIPAGKMALHNDGNHLNNRSSNLRIGTHAENMRDRDNHGRTIGAARPGSLNAKAKLTIEQVREIRNAERGGKALAARFGISVRAARDIRSGTRWGSLS